jgi:hypothetical protein
VRYLQRYEAFFGAVALGLLGVGLVLLSRLVIVPWLESVHGWVVPTDVWTPLRAARDVANGDVFHLYEQPAGRTGYPYTPGLPILLAPAAWIGDRYLLLGDVFYPRPYPSMFLVLGPAEAFVGVVAIVWAAGRAVALRGRALFGFQFLVFLTAAWAPVGWFHPEDTIVCALLVAAALFAGKENWRAVGLMLALALLFKQWALWPAIPFVFAAPPGKRLLTSFYAFGIPALVMLPFLLASPTTYESLAGTRVALGYGQPQLWQSLIAHGALSNATLLRVAWGGVALLVGWVVRERRDTDSLLAACGAVMLARLLFEPELFGYYIVPATVFAIIWCARAERPIALRAGTAVMLGAFCLPQTYPQPVFFALLAFGLAYICGPMLVSLVPETVPRVRFVRYVARG